MKTKLLKKIRREYRIMQNELDEVWIEKRIWSYIPLYEDLTNDWNAKVLAIYRECENNEDVMNLFRKYIHNKYSKYSRKDRIKRIKEKNISVVWYKK